MGFSGKGLHYDTVQVHGDDGTELLGLALRFLHKPFCPYASFKRSLGRAGLF